MDFVNFVVLRTCVVCNKMLPLQKETDGTRLRSSANSLELADGTGSAAPKGGLCRKATNTLSYNLMKQPLTLLLGALMCTALHAQEREMPFLNTVKIEANDSPQIIIEKAAHVVPTDNQLAALEKEFIAFIHFGPNTFTRREWGTGMEDPKVFDLKELDTDQWCEAMKAAGMKMVLFTVKHHDGFVLWQSRYTTHGIMSTDFRDGKGDILKDLSASCQKYGIKLGIYLSPADLYQIENPEGLYGNLSAYTKRTIPREVEGRPFANKTKFEFVVDDYNEYFLNQLFELLTEYGPIEEVWFDGAHPKQKGGQKYNYHAWKELIKTLAPKAVIFGREDVRWCGNEAGGTRATEWNVIPYAQNPDTMSVFHDITGEDLGSREKLYGANFLHYQQAETNTSIREGWFYRDDTNQKVRSADDVFDIYERSVGGNSTFLLNIPPNREGRFSPTDVAVLKETGKRIRETYGTDLLKAANGAAELLDGDIATGVELTAEKPIVISLPQPTTINRIVIQEAVRTSGERVEEHAVDAWIDGEWKEIAKATNIGYKRILRFADVTTDKLRLRLLASRLTPTIATISAHHYKSRPPQLIATRSKDGIVTISPKPQEFGWKSHGEDITANLSAGYTIHYTTDGSAPTAESPLYTAPIALANCDLKAVAVLNGETGATLQELFGFVPAAWKAVSVSSETENHGAALAFDADPSTYWLSADSPAPHALAIDLGERQTLNGFAYTPQQHDNKGMIAKGTVYVSKDGKKWKQVEEFEFGNLINDPSKRYHRFAKPVKARYVKIEAAEIAANTGVAAIAEIDLF